MAITRPEPRQLPRRAAEIIAAARALLESEGRDALTMRRLGQALGIRAPSTLAQAMWSFAHEMVILELDRRYPEGSDRDQTWRAGAEAFTFAASAGLARDAAANRPSGRGEDM